MDIQNKEFSLYSNIFIRNLLNLFQNIRQIKIARYNSVKNQDLFSKVKYGIPKLYNSNVVYKLPSAIVNVAILVKFPNV